MTITEKFQNKRCVFSIECFPPKQTTQMDKMKATLQAMRALNPDFISVTFGAGGSAGGVSTVEVADYIQHEVGVPALACLKSGLSGRVGVRSPRRASTSRTPACSSSSRMRAALVWSLPMQIRWARAGTPTSCWI